MNSANNIKASREGGRYQARLAPEPWVAFGPIDNSNPLKDGRVIWLIDEACNRQALLHRYEDIRRRERGGKWDGSGYPLVHVGDKAMEAIRGHYDPADDKIFDDSRWAWEGLLRLIERQFGVQDDVSMLVKALAGDPEVQDSFGPQWPIARIVRLLNGEQAARTWNDDRVENAKRRLTRFISKFKSTHGLDPIDLRALLVRYARESRAH